MDPTRREDMFGELGGEARLREIIDQFVDQVFADRMIGFFFRSTDRNRIKEMEYQLVAEFLGADVKYQGEPLKTVHARHPIMGGHFARRREILKNTLASFRVPKAIAEAWLAHTDALRPLITDDADSNCDPIAARQRVEKFR